MVSDWRGRRRAGGDGILPAGNIGEGLGLNWQSPLRLRLDSEALVSNWRWLAKQSGAAACGAAVKADGYGLGAREVVARLAMAGCRDFYVATWGEAEALGVLPDGTSLSVLHGVRAEDMEVATESVARPVLNTVLQVKRWKQTGKSCDVMVDTGMNRLGISVEDVERGELNGLQIETLMSHLACADEDVPMNDLQCQSFAGLRNKTSAKRMSLANSAGTCLGAKYAFDLTRPGLAIYGGIPRKEAQGFIKQVTYPSAQIIQRRRVRAGESIGYNAKFIAERSTEIAIVNLGYADGYLLGFSNADNRDGGAAERGLLNVLGRVSMDMVAVCVDGQTRFHEGRWVQFDYNLPAASAASGLSQYELLTGLGGRYQRVWF
jgi:alanine racemase